MLNAIIILVVLLPLACCCISWIFDCAEKVEEQNKPRTPPSEEALHFGCDPKFVLCDYYQAAIDEMHGDNIKFSKTECYCLYLNKRVKIGSKCPYAQAYPDKLSKSPWDK